MVSVEHRVMRFNDSKCHLQIPLTQETREDAKKSGRMLIIIRLKTLPTGTSSRDKECRTNNNTSLI